MRWDRVNAQEGWRLCLAWVSQREARSFTQTRAEELSLLPWSQDWSRFFGWVLKAKVDCCFKEVQPSRCWVTCISRQSQRGRGGWREGEALRLAKVPFLAWVPSVVLLPAVPASRGGHRLCGLTVSTGREIKRHFSGISGFETVLIELKNLLLHR